LFASFNEGISFMQNSEFTVIEGGGVCSASGFVAHGMHAGFRPQPERLDMAVVLASTLAQAAGVFTQNVFCAAPVQVSRAHLNAGPKGINYGTARAIVINSGNANAATGSTGFATAEETAQIAATCIGCEPSDILVASTGVIGQQLDVAPFRQALPEAFSAASHDGGAKAARAIMTTDTHPKEFAVKFDGEDIGYPGKTFTVGGMSKGSGMIMPNMATMIAVLTTDAPVAAPDLHAALKRAVDVSFNKITVDSDTSTNDTCVALASGKACGVSADEIEAATFAPASDAFAKFERALQFVCQTLARDMARDGEGATKLVTVNVEGAATEADADAAARTVANSPLVKTAIFGHDCNWGRIAGALGRSGAKFDQLSVDIDIMGLAVCRGGMTVEFSEEEALARFEDPEIVIDINLGAGTHSTTIWTCDFTHDYVTINGDYRT
jgi:glutamate N-acetyltransferase/amino-acid N-acetyltransferase